MTIAPSFESDGHWLTPVFVGEGQLVSCRVVSGTVELPFGSLDTDAPDGTAQILIRPEEIEVAADVEDAGGARGTITFRRYYGHDALDDIHLENGAILRVRRTSVGSFNPGSAVRLRMTSGSYPLYSESGGMWLARTRAGRG